MSLSTNSTKNLIYSSVEEISNEIWNKFNFSNNIYLSKEFLKSLETNHPNILFYYIILLDNLNNPKAFAAIQIFDFEINKLNNNYINIFTKSTEKLNSLIFPFNSKSLKLLVFGNSFFSGENAYIINTKENKEKVLKEFSKAILKIIDANKDLDINFFLAKDFKDSNLKVSNTLTDFNYVPFSVEPNMVFTVNRNWNAFDDYLYSLKTKFRVKAKKAFTLSKDIKIEDITAKNIEYLLTKMKGLFDRVIDNAEFFLNDFNLNTFKDFKTNFGENYILKAYSINNELVGFLSGVIHNNILDAHFVGIDYQLNKSHAIYQRMLYNYIEIAIKNKLDFINFGRTASEIKSSVGASSENFTLYLRHKNSIKTKILKLFLQGINPTQFKRKSPFKKNYENN